MEVERIDSLEHNFDLVIGSGPRPRRCRIVRRTASGIGVEFLDPIQADVEAILIEHTFKDELATENNAGGTGYCSTTKIRLRRTAEAIVAFMGERDGRRWLYEQATWHSLQSRSADRGTLSTMTLSITSDNVTA